MCSTCEGLLEVQRQIAGRALRLVEVETKERSPFARSLLFGYVGAFVYEGDVPRPRRRRPHSRWTPTCWPSCWPRTA